MAKPGRKSGYTEALADRICDGIAAGRPLTDICREPGMPDRDSIYRWEATHPEFAAKCARARVLAAGPIVESMSDVEADVLSGSLEPNAARVVLWSRQWRASKADAARFGDKLEQTLRGDANAPVQLVLHGSDVHG